MKIAQKEANETVYWLTLCDRMENPKLSEETMSILTEIMKLLSKIIITSKKNLN
jgi:four helix bundle protein